VFPYYELLQSNGSCGGCNENQRGITNLNTDLLMSASYQNLALLIKRLGQRIYDGVPGPTPPGVTPTQAPQTSFSSHAVVSPVSPARGATVSIVVTVTNPPESPALIDLELYDGSFTKLAQQVWDNQQFTAGQPRAFTMSWPVPTTTATGSYTVMIGVFSRGGGALHNWNSSAGTFSHTAAGVATPTATPTPVLTSTPTPTATKTNTPTLKPTSTPTPTSTQGSAQPSFTTSGSASPITALRGSSAALTASEKSTTAISALVDLEVYNAPGSKVFQQAWDNQPFSAAQTLTLPVTWPVSASARTGAHTVRIGEVLDVRPAS
jgi:hypothetical protein